MEAVPPANRKRLKLDLILKTLEATTQRGSDVPVLTKNALELVAELCTVFVVTARARADDEARVESREFITPADIEATLPEMLADF
mmetsp:Transcript_9960/g.32879  ORF Transcript_9960/g.32879 Transcript_9960/m.32879 type:complete len:86 (-) Transcript_9960:202-459(-)